MFKSATDKLMGGQGTATAKPKTLPKGKGRVCLGILLLLVVSLLIYEMNISVKPNSFSKDKEKWSFLEEEIAATRGISITREYQVKLDVESLSNRQKGIERLEKIFSESWKMPLFAHKGQTFIRFVTLFDFTPCGLSYKEQLRKRTHYDPKGINMNYTTLDIKWSTSSGLSSLLDLPFDPSASISHPFQKLETDIHPCKQKYSRESRIPVPQDLDFESCSELFEWFPNVIIDQNLIHEAPGKYVEGQSWWVLDSTFWIGDTMIQCTFNLPYRTFIEALYGIESPQLKSEFSLRIWSPNSGQTPWHNETLAFFDSGYRSALKTFNITCNSY